MIVFLCMIAGFISCISSVYIIFFHNNKYYNSFLKILINLKLVINLTQVLLFIILLLLSDFSSLFVYENSSKLLPLYFKISTLWSCHDGSMILWQLLNSIFVSIFINKNFNNINYETKNSINNINNIINSIYIYAAKILSFIELLFFLYLFKFGNIYKYNDRFEYINDGIGLNPLLQDTSLIIHPPFLYIGYSSLLIVFAASLASIFDNKNSKKYLTLSKNYSLISWFSLTIGIFLGCLWAYRELGWGGYWYFDPVENISLMQWILVLCFHHCLLIYLKKQILHKITILLGLFSFYSIFLGTYFVRSGNLISLHSFASSNNKYFYWSLFITIFSIYIFYVLYKLYHVNNNVLNKNITRKNVDLKSKGILYSSYILLISVFVIIISLIYPSINFIFTKKEINIELIFYISSLIPLFILLGFYLLIYNSDIKNIAIKEFLTNNLNNIILISLGYLILVILYFYNNHSIKYIALFVGVLIIISIIISAIKFYKKGISLINKNLSMIIGHFGAGILFISLSLNNIYKQEYNFEGKVNDSLNYDQFNISLKDIKYAKGQNYFRQIVEFWIFNNETNEITILKPELRLYHVEKSLSSESNFYSYLNYDLYAIISEINDDKVQATIYYNPYIFYIWIGFIILIISIINSFLRNFK